MSIMTWLMARSAGIAMSITGMNEIRNSTLFQMDTDDPDELAALFDNTLRSLLDRHAPVKHKNTTSRPCVP